jgi:hypothetical protein
MHFAILIHDEPDSAALRDQYRFHRWRFGRVMDRFK